MSSPVHNIVTESLAPEPQAAAVEGEAPLSFRAVYDARFHDVLRWVRAMGGRDEDLEDLAQEVFIIVRRKLARPVVCALPTRCQVRPSWNVRSPASASRITSFGSSR